MWLHKILALCWKNYRVRKRHIVMLFVEIFCSIVFFILSYFFLYKLFRNMMDLKDIEEKAGQENLFNRTNRLICYGPDQPWTKAIMRKVGGTLQVGDVDIHVRCSNVSNLNNVTQVVFKNNDTELPRKLEYAIHFKDHDDETNELDELTQPPGYVEIYKEFAALQGAINKAFIELRTGKNVTQDFVKEKISTQTRENSPMLIVMLLALILMCTWVSLLPYAVMLTNRVVHEKQLGIAEILKMFGVNTPTLWLSHVINGLPVYLAYSIINTIIISLMMEKTARSLYFILLSCYFIYMTSLSLLLAAILRSGSLITISIILIHAILMFAPQKISENIETENTFLQFLLCLLPNTPMVWAWINIAIHEAFGDGAQWSNMSEKADTDLFSLITCYAMMLIHSLIFCILAHYLSNVFPGKYGVAKKWNYIFKIGGIIPTKEKESFELVESDDKALRVKVDEKLFEPIPKDAKVGVSIRHVSKVFDKKTALNDVTFDVLFGEITVLLGHNGAGKTTLMSIITGMYSPTSGDVLVDGANTRSNNSSWRKKIGLCPQHNVVFPGVSVEEHIIIFVMLKGLSLKKAKGNSVEILKQVKLSEKAKQMSEKLSGGMKRRLQLACACAGNAEILVLDEPTSGLDIQTRRELWDLILSMRGNRCVLLSTHFMEEADALADRVAALNTGKLVAHATPMHLSRALDTGFVLTLNLKDENQRDRIKQIMADSLPSSKLKSENEKTLVYSLPSKDTAQFPDMFRAIEDEQEQLGIESMGVGVATLEVVFFKYESGLRLSRMRLMATCYNEKGYQPVPPPKLWMNQAKVLFKRHIKYMLYTKFSSFISCLLLPILFIFLATYYYTGSEDSDSKSFKSSMKRHEKTLHNKIDARLGNHYAQNVRNFTLKKNETKSLDYFENLHIGFEVTEDRAKAWYTPVLHLALPVSVNLMSNALANHYIGPSEKSYISTENTLLKIGHYRVKQPKSRENCLWWAGAFAAVVMMFLFVALYKPLIERLSGIRHAYKMAGVSVYLYWLIHLLWYLALLFLCVLVWTILAILIFDSDNTFRTASFIFWLVLLSTLGAAAIIAFVFFLSLLGDSQGILSTILIMLICVYGVIIPFIGALAQNKIGNVFFGMVWRFGYLIPMFHWFLTVRLLASNARVVALCKLNKSMCKRGLMPGLQSDLSLDRMRECCGRSGPGMLTPAPEDYLIIKRHILYLFLCFLLYMALVIFVDGMYFAKLVAKCYDKRYKPSAKEYDDPIVEEERKYVEGKIGDTSSTSGTAQDIGLFHDLHKCFRGSRCRLFKAVKGVSFSVKRGECFGLLGVNGSGKTTIFRMIVASAAKTRGRLQVAGFDQDKNLRQYWKKLTYCPQFDGVDEFMTLRDNVASILTVRGLPLDLVKSDTDQWINVVGLSSARGTVGTYSGGMKRRATTCMALAGATRDEAIVLLDEPTSGVDPAATKHFWSTLPKSQLSMILTSHSMQEAEAMSNRIGIIARGELGALGTAGQLRDSRANGFTAVLKLNQETPEGNPMDKDEVDKLKSDFASMFPSKLKDEHQSMLQYHITDSDIKYSTLFSGLEELKANYPNLIQDYTLANCTLEQVFLSFAKDSDEKNAEERKAADAKKKGKNGKRKIDEESGP